mmetsp:Transcript_9046/g.23311  ORF Transcript_9046/g.23311 Transcript_9046/m.23311 type:complete len:329 (+) Transcript_9046:955-1941(+)
MPWRPSGWMPCTWGRLQHPPRDPGRQALRTVDGHQALAHRVRVQCLVRQDCPPPGGELRGKRARQDVAVVDVLHQVETRWLEGLGQCEEGGHLPRLPVVPVVDDDVELHARNCAHQVESAGRIQDHGFDVGIHGEGGDGGVDVHPKDARLLAEQLPPHLDAAAFLHSDLHDVDSLLDVRLQQDVVVVRAVMTIHLVCAEVGREGALPRPLPVPGEHVGDGCEHGPRLLVSVHAGVGLVHALDQDAREGVAADARGGGAVEVVTKQPQAAPRHSQPLGRASPTAHVALGWQDALLPPLHRCRCRPAQPLPALYGPLGDGPHSPPQQLRK